MQIAGTSPNRTAPDGIEEGKFAWHQSRTVGVLYLAHLLSVVRHRWRINNAAIAVLVRHPIRDLRSATLTWITGECTIDQPRRSNTRSNFSRTASCVLILWQLQCPEGQQSFQKGLIQKVKNIINKNIEKKRAKNRALGYTWRCQPTHCSEVLISLAVSCCWGNY